MANVGSATMSRAGHGRLARAVNYVGQLRAYSYVDLLLLLAAVQASPRVIIGVSLLWFGFLIHLEWRHRDRGRLTWHWSLWIVPWAVAPFVVPSPWLVPFYVLAVAYAYKKHFPAAAAVSPLVNGGLKTFLVLLAPATTAALAGLVLALMTFRNLLGDVRDAEKDAHEGVRTLPVIAGYRRATPWVYPASLVLTSLVWTVLGGLSWWALAAALLVQVATYRLTPR
jgi:1,4-dihydroxy-2-naphthoate octaprenyltransferase